MFADFERRRSFVRGWRKVFMAKNAALGDGPIMFFNEGAHIEVPLSALFFENDQIDTTRADLKVLPAFVNWIKFLSQQKRIVAAATPVAKAMVLTAVEPGAVGNNIQLTVTRKTATTVDLSVSEIDTYVDLTMPTLRTRLGADGAPATVGTHPGLLHVKDYPAGSDTQTVVPTANPVAPTGASPKWTIAGTGASAVTLVPRKGGAAFNAGTTKTIEISNVSPDGATFTLIATWTKTVSDVTLTGPNGLAAAFGALGFLVDATAPDGVFKLPQPGTIRLTGGADPVAIPAVKAGATGLAIE